jgi:penicillin-binding protein 2
LLQKIQELANISQLSPKASLSGSPAWVLVSGEMVIRRSYSVLILLMLVVASPSFAKTAAMKSKSRSVEESAPAKKKMAKLRHSRPVAKTYKAKFSSKKRGKLRRAVYYEHFYASPFDSSNTVGDVTAGEDPVVRAAALDALGNLNGTVVAIDPDTGRVLAMVNQKLALSEGAQPCSTFKVAVGLAALSEGLITADSPIRVGRAKMTLTYALAHSNNAYFEELGRRLGFEKVSYYAQQFGLGELAGYNIEGEHLGTFPSEVLDAKLGGVGKMCSFGESINMTPLQLGAMVAAIANGGNLYYLQHPRTSEELATMQPKLKRHLEIASYIPELTIGMGGAVEYGTARSLRTSFNEEEVLGKTGTCSKDGTRFGWFASYANTQHGRIVTVVFLRGNRLVAGPKAAEITGHVYRNLYDHSFFAAERNKQATHGAAN